MARPKKFVAPEIPVTEDLKEDLECNPESDPLNFMQIIVESLRLLNKLHEALEICRQKIRTEIYYLIERSINEVDIM